jgi:hypothetical protein
MGALSGTAGSVVYFAGSDALLGEIREWSLDLSATPVDVTAFGDGAGRYVPNLNRATGSFSGNLDPDNAVQGSVRSDFLNGANVRLLLYHSGTDYVDAIRAHVTGLSPAIGVDGKATVEYEFQVTGLIDTSAGLTRALMESEDLLLNEDGSGIRTDAVTQSY